MTRISQNDISIRRMQNTEQDYNLILKWYRNPVVRTCLKSFN